MLVGLAVIAAESSHALDAPSPLSVWPSGASEHQFADDWRVGRRRPTRAL